MSKIALSGNASGTGTFTIASPNSNSNYQLDLPAESGTIVTGVSGLNATNLTSGTIPKARMYTGAVLQVLQTIKTDTFSSSSTSWTDVTGLSVSITPLSTTSKILVIVDLQAVGTNTTGSTMRITRGGTPIGNGTGASNRQAGSAAEFYSTRADQFYSYFGNVLDSPSSTSSVTYAVQVVVGGGGGTVYVNRSSADTDSSSYTRGASAITVMEVVG